MILKILAFADVLAILALLGSSILPQNLVILMGIYLIMKGLAFVLMGGLVPNIFDMTIGFYIIIASFGITNWIPTTLAILFLGQKAFLSFV